MTAFLDYLPLLGLTIVVELGVAMLLLHSGPGKIALPLISLNLISHPLATYLVGEDILDWGAAEMAVMVLEGVGYAWATALSWKRAALLALACNGVTATLSLIIPW